MSQPNQTDPTKRPAAAPESERQSWRTLEFHDAVMSNMGEGLYAVDAQGLVTYLNPAAEAMLGWSFEELKGRRMHDVIHHHYPDGRPFPIEECSGLQVLRQGSPLKDHDDHFIRKDGGFFPVTYSSSPLRLGDQTAGLVVVFRDTTEHRRAEAALRDREQRYELVVAGAESAIWDWDVPGKRAMFSPRWKELRGLSDDEVSDREEEWSSRIHPEDQERVMAAVQAHFEGQTPVFAEEYRVRHKDGHWVWILDRGIAHRDAAGKVVRMAGSETDITERRLADERLRESERQLRLALEAGRMGAWQWHIAENQVTWSPGLEAIHGLPPGSFEGTFAAYQRDIHPEDRDRVLQAITQTVEQGKDHHLEYRILHPDGEVHWLEARGRLLFDEAGHPTRMVGVCTDVTQRKADEQRLRQRNERLRLLFEAAAILLHGNDPHAMLRELFAKIGPHLGLDTCLNYMVDESGEVLQLESWIGLPDGAARSLGRLAFGEGICGMVAQQRQPFVATCIQESDDPKAQLVKSLGIRAYASSPIRSGERLLGTLAFASRTRDELGPEELAFLETICHYVTVTYERLRLLNELKEADRRKDEFLATLAHELRNPLAPVRNAVQVLRLTGADEPELRWSRDVIDRQVTHLTRLIDDLLDINRITRNKLELRKDRVELADVITGAVETSRPLIEECGHHLTVSLPPEPIYVHADLVRLAQVFMNLLTNAAKYTDRGGHIWLVAERDEEGGREVVVRVKDTGMGIAPQILPRLFEMFFQVNRGVDRSQGGLGVGLSLVRRLVELHGGSVRAESAGPGTGSEFTVRLPILADADPAHVQSTTGDPASKTATPRRILVVDDNRDSADSLALVLRLGGNQVQTAYDGLSAVEAAREFRPEVMLLDIGMPKLSGYEACRRIREQPWGKDMVLVALTGWGQEEDQRRTQAAGFDSHLVKPVDPGELGRLLGARG